MSWDNKTDYCGLAVANTLLCKGANNNNNGQYLQKPGSSGAIAATKPYGPEASPSCEYIILKDYTFAAGDIKLGAVTTVGTGANAKRYALEQFQYENGADAEPTFTAQSKEIEASSDGTQRTFDVPSFSISPDEAAAMIMSAGTIGGTGCELTKCTLTASCSVKPHKKNGVTLASDVTMGQLTVAVEILQRGDTEPTLTAGTGWDISAPLSCNDPDSDFPVWSATLAKPLSYTQAAQSSQT